MDSITNDSTNRHKIAVIKSGAIGDVLMTTPFLRGLRKTFPKSEITYIVGEWSSNVLEGNPNIDKIMPFDESIIFQEDVISKFKKMISLSNKVKKERFDLCFVMDKSWMVNMFSFLSGIKDRVGFSRGWEGFPLTKKIEYKSVKHEIEYYLNLLVYFSKEKFSKELEIRLTPEDRKLANKMRLWKGKKKLIGISISGGNPGQTSTYRDWPVKNFQNLINALEKTGKLVVLLGTNNKGVSGKNVRDLTGKTTIKEAAAIMEVCDAFVTSDTGLMHIASAIKTPTVSIFGPTDPRRKAPLNGNSVYLWKGSTCDKCELYGKYCDNHPSANEITVENVEEKLKVIL
jgi:heptosyltransferase II